MISSEKLIQLVTVTHVEVDGPDYIVSISRPDGSIVRVLIPAPGHDSFIDNACSSIKPYGLNFVTDGHCYSL